MVVWGDEPMVYMCQSLGGSCSGALWTVAMSWSRRSSGRRLTALTHRVSGSVGLDQPPLGAPSGDFLVAKEGGSRG